MVVSVSTMGNLYYDDHNEDYVIPFKWITKREVYAVLVFPTAEVAKIKTKQLSVSDVLNIISSAKIPRAGVLTTKHAIKNQSLSIGVSDKEDLCLIEPNVIRLPARL